MSNLTHINSEGQAQMVDVKAKTSTHRLAKASGRVFLSETAFKALINNHVKKGDVLSVAKTAGILGAKKTYELIPLCHNIPIDSIQISFTLDHNSNAVLIESEARTEAKTGIEMEALAAVTIAALTIYDMCKAIDKSIRISDIKLTYKSGGKSGVYEAS